MAAIVNVCVDPRLDHASIRRQVQARLERMRLPTANVYVTNDVGGNVGSGFRGTARLLQSRREPIVAVAVLHHDDCLAARAGRRATLDKGVEAIGVYFAEIGVTCPVLTGTLSTETGTLTWSDEPAVSNEVLRFRMPRMYG